MRKRRIVGTAGHIDHGKTALVRALTGIDTDRLPEEKRRGITIDLGFASLATDQLQIGFIDVPGHERFVRNMLAGIGGIDAAMLVVAADESIKPQTREHFAICRLLQIPTGLIAITKRDLVDQDMFGLVRMEIEDLVRGSFLAGKPIVPVSSTTGQGIEELKRSLAEILESIEDRDTASRVFRLPIDRVFTMKGFGCVVTGTTISGTVQADSEVEVLPSGLRSRARHIEVHGEGREAGSAGERTSINLPDLQVDDLKRGDQLVPPGVLHPTQIVTAQLELLADAASLKDQSRIRFHHFSSELIGSIRIVGTEKKEIAPGSRAYVQIRLESPVVAISGDRFVIRRYAPQETIGGGVVLDPHLGRLRRGSPAELFETLATGSMTDRVMLLARLAGLRGVTVADMVARTGMVPDRFTGIHPAELNRVGDRWVHREHLEMFRRRAMEYLMEYFRAKPMSIGLPKGEFLQKLLPSNSDAQLSAFLLDDLTAEKIVAVEGDIIQVPGRSRELRGAEGELARLIAERFREADLQPPPVSELIKTIQQKPKVIEGVVGYLVKTGVLIRLSEGLYVHREPLQKARERIAELRGKSAEVGWFKEFFGLSRKVLIPLMEYFDRVGATRRTGDRREVL